MPDVDREIRVFLLEDDEISRLLFTELLLINGVTSVVESETLADAQSWVSEIISGSFDVVVLDVMLPDGLSLDLAHHIKVHSEALLCFYTGRASEAELQTYSHMDPEYIFVKPLRPESFAAGWSLVVQALRDRS